MRSEQKGKGSLSENRGRVGSKQRTAAPNTGRQRVGDVRRAIGALGGGGGVSGDLALGSLQRVLLGFSHPFSLILFIPRGNRLGTRREGITFLIERLIIHLAEELGFKET